VQIHQTEEQLHFPSGVRDIVQKISSTTNLPSGVRDDSPNFLKLKVMMMNRKDTCIS